MSQLDLWVIFSYFLVVFLIGVWVQKSLASSEDLFLAGRSLKWPMIGFSLFASNISSSTIIGLAGAAYSVGIAIANYEWVASLVLLFVAAFCIPVFIKTHITTLPEFLELNYNRAARRYYSLITIVLSILVDTAGGLYAGAIALNIFFPNLPVWQICVGLGLFAGAYTAMGGLKAVVYTDFLQALTLLLGSCLLTYTLFSRLDFSWATLVRDLPIGHLSLIRPLSDPNMPWLGTFFGLPLMGFWYWSTNQYITQRILGAKDIEHARWGAALGAALKLIPLFTMVLPGVMAIKLFPNLENPDMVYPVLIKELLPNGLIGLVVAGFIAAIMSSVDSTLNSASTLILHDFVLPTQPDMSAQKQLRWGRVTTLVLMLVAIAWAPFISQMGGLYMYLQQSFAILVPPVVVVFIMGLFSRYKIKGLGFQTLLFGHGVGLVFFVMRQFHYINIHFTIGVPIVFIISLAFYWTNPWRLPAVAKKESVYFSFRELQPSRPLPWFQDYRLWSGLVLAMLLCMLVLFW